MKALSLLLAGAGLCLMGACATTPEPPAKFHVEVIDNPDENRFELILISDDMRDLCFGEKDWVNEGRDPGGRMTIVLHSDDTAIPARTYEIPTKDCDPQGCKPARVLHPRGRLNGYLNYAGFGDPEEVRSLPDRKLEFVVQPRVCDAYDMTVLGRF